MPRYSACDGSDNLHMTILFEVMVDFETSRVDSMRQVYDVEIGVKVIYDGKKYKVVSVSHSQKSAILNAETYIRGFKDD